MRFTDEQRRAIAQRGSSLFLHAGAGSGKTAVLVERFVASVREDGARVDSILAITYTERAAAELKARIRRRFLAEGDRRHAREAERAWVSTIHGFCSRVLRAHALEAGLDPEYRVVEESEAARTARAAFESALEEFAAGGGAERLELLARYTPDKLSAMVRTVYGDLRSRGQREPSLPPVEGPRPAGREPAELAEAVSAALGELSGSGCSGKAVEAALRRLEGCRDALAGLGDELGQSADFEELRVKAGAARALKTEAFARLAEAHEAYVVACRAREAHRDYGLLRDLLAVYGRAYGEAKSARSALDFEDLELRCRDLLQRRPALRERYRDRFTQVMVDEFQDTNQLQNEILSLVARDNLFTVGDELQSIYSFRHADPGVFAAHREAAERELRAARLSANFRSAPELLDALNAAFTAVDGFPLYPLRRPPAGDGSPAPVEGRLFDPDGPQGAHEPAVELLVVDRDKGRWDRAIEQEGTATAEVENGAPAAPVWGSPRLACLPVACARSSTEGPGARGTWPCCFAPPPTSRSTSARWPTAGCPRTSSAAVATGPSSRSPTCAPTWARWPTRSTSSRCSRSWRLRSSEHRSMRWFCFACARVRSVGTPGGHWSRPSSTGTTARAGWPPPCRRPIGRSSGASSSASLPSVRRRPGRRSRR